MAHIQVHKLHLASCVAVVLGCKFLSVLMLNMAYSKAEVEFILCRFFLEPT